MQKSIHHRLNQSFMLLLWVDFAGEKLF